MEYNEICDALIDDLTEKSLFDYEENVPEMKQLSIKVATLSDEIFTAAKDLPEKLRNDINSFSEVKNELNVFQLKHVYKQGALDCVKLLKKLGVI